MEFNAEGIANDFSLLFELFANNVEKLVDAVEDKFDNGNVYS